MQKKIYSNLFIGLSLFLVLSYCSKDQDEGPSPKNPEITSVKTFGGSKNDAAQSILKTSDGGYAVLGYTQSLNGDILDKSDESFDYWMLKFDADNLMQWQKTFGGSLDDKGSDLLQTSDGGYIIFGSSKSSDGDLTNNAGDNDFWMVKLDSNGNIDWQKTFGFLGLDLGITVIPTNDNGFLLSGVLDVTASGGEGNSKLSSTKRHAGGDYWIIKLDASGTKQWSKYYGGTFTDTPYDAIQTPDNGFIIVGSSDSEDVDISSNRGSYDFWVLKVSEFGILEWEKSFGGSEIDEAWGIEHSGDGNYLIVGDTRSMDQQISNNKGAADIWIIKITPNGELIWEKTLGGSGFDAGRSISSTQEGNFIISGNSRSNDDDLTENKGQNDAWIIKIDANANIIWQKTVGGSMIDLAYDAAQLDNGKIIAVGESSSTDADITENKGFTDLLIINLNE